ncbi:MAG: hypothetical protein WKH97_09050 [Casimicrobiaceae bacterium]
MATPDYSEWLMHSQWTLAEAAALAAGVEPVRDDRPNKLVETVLDAPQRKRIEVVYRELKSATGTERARKREGFTEVEASRTGLIGNTRVLTSEFLAWAGRRRFELPEPLRVAAPAAPSPVTATEAHVSERLATLNQTARKFWGNVNREERDTIPTIGTL